MKNKIIFAIVFMVIVAVGIASMVFLSKKGSSISVVPEVTPTPVPVQNQVPVPEMPKVTTINTDSFDLTLPIGWDMTSRNNILPITAINSKEDFASEKAKEMDFRTNLSINGAQLGNYSLKDYVGMVKDNLTGNISVIEITKEEETPLAGHDAYFMEIESTQQELEFGTLIAFVVDGNNFVWAFSFNTLQNLWGTYKNDFYETIKGINLK